MTEETQKRLERLDKTARFWMGVSIVSGVIAVALSALAIILKLLGH